MTYIAMSLTDPVSGVTSVLQPRDGVTVMVLDVQPAVRAIAEERALAAGQVDTTVNVSAAAVTVTLRLWPGVTQTAEAFLDEIGVLLNPALRPYLVVTNDAWPQQRQLTVRFSAKTGPVSDPTFVDVAVSWVAPKGVWEAAAVATAVLQAFIASSTGLVVDVPGLVVTAAGVTMPATSAPSPSRVTSAGSMPCDWSAVLYGPCAGPALANDTTGGVIEFSPDLVLGAGSYVALDSAAHTAFLNGDPSASVLQYLNFTTLTWWQMQAGLNILRYYPSSAGSGAQAVVSFRPAWMT